MGVALPFANQDGSRLGLPNLGFLRRASSGCLFGEPKQQAAGGGFESTVSTFLEAIRDRARQEGPADFLGRRFSVLRFPALAEFIDAELRQARDFRGERISVQNRRPPVCGELLISPESAIRHTQIELGPNKSCLLSGF